VLRVALAAIELSLRPDYALLAGGALSRPKRHADKMAPPAAPGSFQPVEKMPTIQAHSGSIGASGIGASGIKAKAIRKLTLETSKPKG
jgi:hypothetical protein